MTDGKTKDDGTLRTFPTGATRDTSDGKLDFEGFLSPAVLHQYARYMNMNRLQSDGTLRDSDNWQKGMGLNVYMKSGFRHFFEWWTAHRRGSCADDVSQMAALCGLLFNVMGYMHELLVASGDEIRFDDDEPTAEMKERQDRLEENSQDTKVAPLPHGTYIAVPRKPPCYDECKYIYAPDDCGDCPHKKECDEYDCSDCKFTDCPSHY